MPRDAADHIDSTKLRESLMRLTLGAEVEVGWEVALGREGIGVSKDRGIVRAC